MSFGLKSYLEIFYINYIGISQAYWLVIIVVLQVWDAINDPIIGGLVDNTKHGKHHKYWNWIFFGGLLLLFSGALLFIPWTKNSPQWLKIVICCVGYCCWDLAYTMVNVPYGTMNAVITEDPVERSQLSTWRSIGSIVGNMLIMVLVPTLIYDSDSKLLGGRLFYVGLALGIVGFTMFLFFLKVTVIRKNENDVEAVDNNEPVQKKKFNYFRALKNFVSNRAIVGVTLAAFIQLVMTQGAAYAVSILNSDYFHQAKVSGIVSVLTFLPMVGIIPFVKPLVKKFGKQAVSTAPLLFGIVVAVVMIIYNPSQDYTGLIIWNILYMLIYGSMCGNMMVCWALVSDAIDYNEVKTGERDEGTTYAIYSFGRKVAQGVGKALILGMLMIFAGYVDGMEVGSIDAKIALNTKYVIAVTYLVCLVLQYICLRFVYNLDKKKVDEMQVALGRTSDDLIGQTGDDLE